MAPGCRSEQCRNRTLSPSGKCYWTAQFEEFSTAGWDNTGVSKPAGPENLSGEDPKGSDLGAAEGKGGEGAIGSKP